MIYEQFIKNIKTLTIGKFFKGLGVAIATGVFVLGVEYFLATQTIRNLIFPPILPENYSPPDEMVIGFIYSTCVVVGSLFILRGFVGNLNKKEAFKIGLILGLFTTMMSAEEWHLHIGINNLWFLIMVIILSSLCSAATAYIYAKEDK